MTSEGAGRCGDYKETDMAVTKEFIWLKTTELMPYENNPRKNDEAVAEA